MADRHLRHRFTALGIEIQRRVEGAGQGQQHRRLARSRGLDAELQARIFEGPDAEGLTDRERVLITATDEFVVTRGVSPQTWQTLAGHLTKAQLIEFCLLAAQYDGLAATISTLGVPLDFPD